MDQGKLVLSVLVALLLASALPALSQKGKEKAEQETAVATLRLVQCSLAGGCVEAGYRLREIEGVEEVDVYPSVSEFDVEYDPEKTTPEKVVESFNRENAGSRVELLGSARSASELEGRERHPRWCSFRPRDPII